MEQKQTHLHRLLPCILDLLKNTIYFAFIFVIDSSTFRTTCIRQFIVLFCNIFDPMCVCVVLNSLGSINCCYFVFGKPRFHFVLFCYCRISKKKKKRFTLQTQMSAFSVARFLRGLSSPSVFMRRAFKTFFANRSLPLRDSNCQPGL